MIPKLAFHPDCPNVPRKRRLKDSIRLNRYIYNESKRYLCVLYRFYDLDWGILYLSSKKWAILEVSFIDAAADICYHIATTQSKQERSRKEV